MSKIWDFLVNSFEEPIHLLSMFLTAVIIFFVGLIVGRIAGKLVRKLLKRIEINKLLKKAQIEFDAEVFSEKVVKWTIYIIALMLALNELGIGSIILNILLISFIVIAAIIIILGIKDSIPNAVAGICIRLKRNFKVGDKISVKDIKGKVDYINLTHVKVKDAKGNIIVIPSSVLTKNKVTVYKR